MIAILLRLFQFLNDFLNFLLNQNVLIFDINISAALFVFLRVFIFIIAKNIEHFVVPLQNVLTQALVKRNLIFLLFHSPPSLFLLKLLFPSLLLSGLIR